jgi:hypothetical protein
MTNWPRAGLQYSEEIVLLFSNANRLLKVNDISGKLRAWRDNDEKGLNAVFLGRTTAVEQSDF